MLKLKLNPHQNSWFFSDPHFDHLNLCRATTKWRREIILDGGEVAEVIPDNVRNFNSLELMNNTILNNINSVVAQDDIIFCLGDFSFNGFENIKIFRDRIICKNFYHICGNHDEKIIANKGNIQEVFTKVYEDHYLEIDIDGTHMVLSHYPICSWNHMAKGVIHLHGHVHLPGHQKIGQGRSLDVGVDGNNFKPYNLKEIISLMKDRPIRSLSLPADHHSDDFDRKIKK